MYAYHNIYNLCEVTCCDGFGLCGRQQDDFHRLTLLLGAICRLLVLLVLSIPFT